MNEFDEAFASTLAHEAKRRPVWVVGLKPESFGELSCMTWSPIAGFVVGELNDMVLVHVPKSSKNPWSKKPSEVYETEEAALKAAIDISEVQAKQWREMMDFMKEQPMQQMGIPSKYFENRNTQTA